MQMTDQQTGTQLRKGAIDALPLPRVASGRPGHPRRRTHAAAQDDHGGVLHPGVREVARPGAEGDLAQGVAHPGPEPERLRRARPERRDQQADAREAHVGGAGAQPRRPQLHARRRRRVRRGGQGDSGRGKRVQVRHSPHFHFPATTFERKESRENTRQGPTTISKDPRADPDKPRYFGRARDLPGVKELFASATKPPPSSSTKNPTTDLLRKNVDASYYGYNLDEEDGTLLAYEAQKEREAYENLLAADDEGRAPKGWEPLPGDSGDGEGWRLPSAAEVQEELVERRRRRLLDKLG